ncbi:MAG: DUF4038 domain-containing protein, partial [Planctomycetes bacterium]|nr:DUF4038 domain-containing protein [Planctomycetota bacterium]
YLSDECFVPMLETVRRDHTPSWKAYFNFKETYARYVQYIISRYGAFNLIFSGIHLDAIPKGASLTAEELNEALTYHHEKYGGLPFGQPYTTLISWSTYQRFGHGEDCSWLTMHSVGNEKARDHGITPELESHFFLEPPYPTINLEPYYTGWRNNTVLGERPEVNSARDNYFSRAMMYGCVLSGALSGHVHGHAGYACTTTSEPAGEHPFISEALQYESGEYMQHLKTLILSEGARYQELLLASNDIDPRKAPLSGETGLDGWSYMMRTKDKGLCMLYFENKALRAKLSNMKPGVNYKLHWFDPDRGLWLREITLRSDSRGVIEMPAFAGGQDVTQEDWAAKLVIEK